MVVPLAMTVSARTYELCRSTPTVSAELSRVPDHSPGDVVQRLYPPSTGTDQEQQQQQQQQRPVETPTTAVAAGASARKWKPLPRADADELDKAKECGKWTEPSELFLRVSGGDPPRGTVLADTPAATTGLS